MKNRRFKHRVKSLIRFGLKSVSPLFSRVSSLDTAAARKNLQEVCPIPSGVFFRENSLAAPSVDLQIVIPAYNVEAYLDECMESVLNQKTAYSYHIVLVDDGAKDNTPAICDKYANHSQVTVIHQANRGLSGARNKGLETLFGKYVMFLDSDDILMDGTIQALLDVAFAHDCDLVEGSMCYLHKDHQELMQQFPENRKISDPYKDLHGHGCGKIYRADLFRNLCFPEGFLYEDSIVSFLIFPKLTNAWVSSHICYGYRVNESGIVRSSHGNPRSIETYWITETLMAQYAQFRYPLSSSYFHSVLEQFRLNQHRISDLDEKIQESVFVLSCELLRKYFPETMDDPSQRQLLRALRKCDFGSFKVCCKLF